MSVKTSQLCFKIDMLNKSTNLIDLFSSTVMSPFICTVNAQSASVHTLAQ